MDKYSFLNAVHPSFVAELYDTYLKTPDEVEPSWRAFFQGFDFGVENGSAEALGVESSQDLVSENVYKEFQVIKLIDGYRTRGHLFTKTNPVRNRRTYNPTLDLENFDLSVNDLKTVFKAGEIVGIGEASLEDIIKNLQSIYCESIGVEYMYIRKPEERKWIQEKLHNNSNQPKYNSHQKKLILKKLNEAVSFESFLHTKYVGQKRFSLEGGESLIPALDILIKVAAERGVKEFVMGMAHRGRLNTLINIFGKSAKDIFSEFDGKDYEQDIFDGDVKYHLGWTSKRILEDGKEINLNIAPNPSHLETVGAVVEGIVRAKQDKHYKNNIEKVLPIIVHGDAAIAGQGIVYEIVQMAALDGYKTGGTIHIVVNNQIGFTTNYLDARSSTYCTDVAKVTLSPVLHVNADDAEAVVHAMIFALEYRMEFGKDVFVDLLGYRKYGHNEGDEPRFTQPKLYKAIAKHPNSRDIYADKLLKEGVVEEGHIKKLEADYKNKLNENLEDSRKENKAVITAIMQDEWEGFKYAKEDMMMLPVDTTFSLEELSEITEVISKLPTDKKFLRKIERLIEARNKMYFETNALDWSMAETLAYGTLLKEGYNVRMSGQDVERGTFSHRHAVVKVEDSEEEIVLLNQLKGDQGDFFIYNSSLSEYGVVGFDYGYAMASPNTLTIWEAQFGDFSNGAQIMIDQYLSAAEDKWELQNGLVMLLPHGYEGQGAEHSSARMERYLQLCARDNMFIANCTTPANLFHLLRRQMKREFRKPLVVFSPKLLLRHPRATSSLDSMAKGSFQEVLDDPNAKIKDTDTIVFCSGKFYYEATEKAEKLGVDNMAFVRIEQLYPLPKTQIDEILVKYKNAKNLIWAQEEPSNMGAWTYMAMQLRELNLTGICRHASAASAEGSHDLHKRRLELLFNELFVYATLKA